MAVKNLKKNTFLNLVNIAVNTIISFVTRTYLIRYLGLETLGVNATIVETINMLNVTELGIQAAISYKMYEPIQNNDIERQQKLFALYRKAYRLVGLIIFTAGLCILPFLKAIVNTKISMTLVYAVYLLQLGNAALGYALSYYKLLFLTHEKQYVTTRIDILVTIFARIVQMVLLFLTKNYIIYIACNYIISIFGNYIIKQRSKKDYNEIIQPTSVEKGDVLKLFSELKQMVVGTLMTYINGSTDNIMNSFFFGSLSTGFVSNYKTVTNIMKTFLSSLVLSLTPTWGTYLYSKNNDEASLRDHLNSSIFAFYVLLIILLVPTLCLIDSFVVIWLGKEFVIDKAITILVIVEIFCAFLNEPARLITNNYGMFKEEKEISIVATIFNLACSFLFSKLIGTPGIFIGTLVSTLICWILRSRVVMNKCYKESGRMFEEYWLNNLLYVATFFALSFLCSRVTEMIVINNLILQFIIRGIAIEIILVVYFFVFWKKDTRMEFLLDRMNLTKIKEKLGLKN